MARAGLLHVTVIAATLLRDNAAGGSELAETYASVGCGSQNFTTSSVKNHTAKPAWNESYTFKFDERSELESQHILIEIFAEKPKLDQLLGLAKIPLQRVVTAGDEISTHSLNRPDEEYTGHEQYSGHVKVALRWDSVQRASTPAYPQTYTPAARYNPNAPVAKSVRTPSGQRGRPMEELRTSKSGEELHNAADMIFVNEQDRKAHHRSSSCPPSHIFKSSAPSHSQPPWRLQPLQTDDSSTPQQHPSFVQPPAAHPSGRHTAARHSSFEGPANASSQQENGRGSSHHVPYSGPHLPYVPHEGNKAEEANGHAAPAQPTEPSLGSLYPKPPLDDVAKGKLSRSKQAEMMKLAELSKLTELAKTQATGLAKAGQQQRPKHSIVHAHQQSQVSPMPKTSNALLTQPDHVSEKQRNDVAGAQAPNGTQKNVSTELTVVPTMLDIVQHESQTQPRDANAGKIVIRPQHRPDVIYEKAIQEADKLDQKKKKKKTGPFRQTLKILRKTSRIFGV